MIASLTVNVGSQHFVQHLGQLRDPAGSSPLLREYHSCEIDIAHHHLLFDYWSIHKANEQQLWKTSFNIKIYIMKCLDLLAPSGALIVMVVYYILWILNTATPFLSNKFNCMQGWLNKAPAKHLSKKRLECYVFIFDIWSFQVCQKICWSQNKLFKIFLQVC